MTPAQYNEYQRQAEVIEQHERWKAEQEKIKQLAEELWEGCHGCDENDKNMWINGFIKAYRMQEDRIHTNNEYWYGRGVLAGKTDRVVELAPKK